MEENQSTPPPPPEGSPAPPTPDPYDLQSQEPVDFWKNLRWFLSRVVALLGAFVLLGAVITGFSGWYTSRSEFCRSCHIMEPYYVSWQESTHSDVSCIKCHFPPGVAEKARGKLLGLVQLVKYVTSTQGPRPVAEIPDESCLRSGCHESRLLAGRIDFDGIPFDHGPHLGELRRGKQLRCTSCHSQIVQGSHMTVTQSTCFLCHFKDEHFNEGLGACTRCHQIPEQDYDLGGGTKFNHELAYEKGVDCANCHGDLIRGDGPVPPERCGTCHNRADDLARIDDHEFMHQKHVTDHKVDCMMCHLEIKHSLDPERIVNAAADCASCHPGHHQEQVAMMEGTGGRAVQAPRRGMAVIRVACQSCHRVQQVSPTGTVVWRASTESCLQCHDRQVTDWLLEYHGTLRDSLTALDEALSEVRQAAERAELDPATVQKIRGQLDDIAHDIEFLRVGNGIHNIHYASSLTEGLVGQLTELATQLQIPPPEITLPEPPPTAAAPAEPNERPATAEAAAAESADPQPDEQEAAKPQPAEPEVTEPEAEAPGAEAPEPAEDEMSEPDPESPPAASDSVPAAPESVEPGAEPESAAPEPEPAPEPGDSEPAPSEPAEPAPAEPAPAEPAPAEPAPAEPAPAEPAAAEPEDASGSEGGQGSDES